MKRKRVSSLVLVFIIALLSIGNALAEPMKDIEIDILKSRITQLENDIKNVAQTTNAFSADTVIENANRVINILMWVTGFMGILVTIAGIVVPFITGWKIGKLWRLHKKLKKAKDALGIRTSDIDKYVTKAEIYIQKADIATIYANYYTILAKFTKLESQISGQNDALLTKPSKHLKDDDSETPIQASKIPSRCGQDRLRYVRGTTLLDPHLPHRSRRNPHSKGVTLCPRKKPTLPSAVLPPNT